jgi:tetratricopeptide (TPR) repeat protein
MRSSAILAICALLAACATSLVAPPPAQLFNDPLFPPPSERISADDVFAVNPAMKHFLNTELAGQVNARGLQQGFVDALFTKGQLKLEYDSAMTRNAAQAFDARAGNCLSLVIMTAALAKEMGLPIRYRRVFADDSWSRSGDVYFSIGHVNLALGRPSIEGGFGRDGSDTMTIDFLPPEDVRRTPALIIGEETIVAMYMNNRAAEAVARGQLDDAYWWARAAIAKDRGFLNAYNTLGVIYHRHGNLREAEYALGYALDGDPKNAHIMSNLARVLGDLGKDVERRTLIGRLQQLEPNPPFSFYDRGRKALREGDFRTAKAMFAKEVDRAPDYAEFHFWLAVACLGLREMGPAREELDRAIKYSANGHDRDLYAAKLARINSHQPR